jgi:hypothetical protein
MRWASCSSKTTVGHYREESKDAYDIYYYCRYSEDSVTIREMLANAVDEPAIARTVRDLKTKFIEIDSKWIEMILDEMSLIGQERDREAQFVIRTMKRWSRICNGRWCDPPVVISPELEINHKVEEEEHRRRI